MIIFSHAEVAIYYGTRVVNLRQRGRRWRSACPIHQGKRDSFSVDSETGLWRCWSVCGRGGDIIALEIALTGAPWREAVAEVEHILSRNLINHPATRTERRGSAERRERERREIRAAEYFRIAAASVAQQILNDELYETVPERYDPTQLLLHLRDADTTALLAIYRDFRAREPKLTAALVYAGDRAWQRLCTRLARFIAAGLEVPNVA